MNHITIIDRSGVTHRLEAVPGDSVMEIARDGGVDDILAICGGGCSCATCHVYVDPDFLDRLPPITEDEDELLETSDARRPESRLSCQIHFVEALDGLIATVAPE